jgi:hypothetical protein
MKVKMFSRDGGFVAEAVIPAFNDPPEAILWGVRLFVLPQPENYGHRHVRDLPPETDVTAYVEAWAYAIPIGVQK